MAYPAAEVSDTTQAESSTKAGTQKAMVVKAVFEVFAGVVVK